MAIIFKKSSEIGGGRPTIQAYNFPSRKTDSGNSMCIFAKKIWVNVPGTIIATVIQVYGEQGSGCKFVIKSLTHGEHKVNVVSLPPPLLQLNELLNLVFGIVYAVAQ